MPSSVFPEGQVVRFEAVTSPAFGTSCAARLDGITPRNTSWHCLLSMLAINASSGQNNHPVATAGVAVEVLNATGHWVGGFDLLQFHQDGLVTIQSRRTGAMRRLPQGQWRDPIEDTVLIAHGIGN